MESNYSFKHTPNSKDAANSAAAAMPSSSASTKAAAQSSHSSRMVHRSLKQASRAQYNLNYRGEVGTVERALYNTKKRIRNATSIDKKLTERGTFRQQTRLLKGRGFWIQQQEYEGLVMQHESHDKTLSVISAANERCHTSVDKLSDNLTGYSRDRM